MRLCYVNVALLLLSAAGVEADTTLNAVDSGWYNSLGEHDGANLNYVVGVVDAIEGLEFRDFFVFDLSSVSGPIVSATVRFPLVE